MNVLLSDLKAAVTNAAHSTSPRATMPVLQNILLQFTGDQLEIAGTNLERFYLTRIDAREGEAFAITVPAKTLADIVNSLGTNEVTLTYDPKTVKLSIDGGAAFSINGIDAGEFPPLPNPLTDPVRVDQLVDPVRLVAFAASDDDARPTLQGIYWADGYMVATDGFRIARAKAPEGVKALVPAASWVEAVKHFTESVHIQSRNGQLAFDDGDTFFVSQQIEGRYPDYQAIIPNSFKHKVKFSRSELLAALKRLAIIARDGVNLVSLHFDGKQVEFSTSAETGNGSEIVPCQTDDEEEWTIHFNITFLREAVEACGGDVYLRLNTDVTPAQIDGGKPADWLCVIMPMHKG